MDKIEDNEDGYVFVCVLNDYSMWGTKTKAWQEMQQEFCPDYETIRNSKNEGEVKTRNKNKGILSSLKGTLGGIFAGFEDNTEGSSQSATVPSGQVSVRFPDDNLHTEPVINSNGNNQKVNFTTKSIISDDNAVEVIKIFLGVKSHRITDLFIEFQKSYRTGFYSKNPSQYRRNNSDVIDHFCKWCLSTKNRNALERIPENSRKLDELKSYLLNYYRD